MKKLAILLITACFLFVSSQADAQQGRLNDDGNQVTFVTSDSLHDISGSDTTIYWKMDGNKPWTIQIKAESLGVTGNDVSLTRVGSVDGISFYPYTGADNVKTVTAAGVYNFTGTSNADNYMGVKIAKNTSDTLTYSIKGFMRKD